MAKQPMEVRRETRECLCGQKIVVEAGVDSQSREEEPRVIALYSESGVELEQCPRCGVAPTKWK